MSVFKRLSNVAKGKLKEIGENLGEFDPFGELDPPKPPSPRQEEPKAAPAPRGASENRDILARLLHEGLLSQAEHDEKLAAMQNDVGQPDSRKPMKRTL